MYADQGFTGEKPKGIAAERGIELQVVKQQEAERGYVLLPKRQVNLIVAGPEWTFGCVTRFRRLVRDYERVPETLK